MRDQSYRQTNLTLAQELSMPTLAPLCRTETMYGLKSLLPSYGGRSLHKQSHGESFLSLVLNRFSGNSLFILDEPEASLSPTRQMTFMATINQLIQKIHSLS
ncbi:MAG: hypothetical protein SAqBPW_30660 [Shewanella algae]